MKQVYPVIFTQLNDKKDTVLINVPDMGILTEGFGLSDAIEMARDAIGANGITLQDLGREIPVPSDISDIDIKNGPFDNDGISHVSFVDIDFDEYRGICMNDRLECCSVNLHNIVLAKRYKRSL